MFPRPFFSYRVQFPHFLEMKLSKGHVRITIILYGFIVFKKRKCYLNLFHFMSFTSLLTSKIGSPQKNIIISYVLYSKVVMVFFQMKYIAAGFNLISFWFCVSADGS